MKVSDNSIDVYRFNWTMSYHSESEVSDCWHGCSYSKQNKQDVGVEKGQKNFDKVTRDEIEQQFIYRKYGALLFMSKCDQAVFKKALEFGQHYPVTIYTSCYYHKPAATSSVDPRIPLKVEHIDTCPPNSDCQTEKFKTHRYYISLYSNNCTEYLSRQFWRILRAYTIPIVMHPRVKFYDALAPKSSFIHLEDYDYEFDQLAKYLRLVDERFDLFAQKHAWRVMNDIVFSPRQTERRLMCELCTKLNTENSVIYYDRVSSWFNKKCSAL
jgi:hypothetical protein